MRTADAAGGDAVMRLQLQLGNEQTRGKDVLDDRMERGKLDAEEKMSLSSCFFGNFDSLYFVERWLIRLNRLAGQD